MTQYEQLVEAIRNKKKITFFLGAGISTSCGIPDFRSPKTGLYANLKRMNLPYPEAVFDIDYFKANPKPFYTLCGELYPGKFFPSKFHFLLKLFENHNLLSRIYTQNIDTLEQLAGVSPEKVIFVHGSFAANHCVDCFEEMSSESLKEQMLGVDGVPVCAKCQGYVKPDIVFFGESLPTEFFEAWDDDLDNVELAIVAGTSLAVFPFAGLPEECPKSCRRVLINNELVGCFKTRKRKSDLVYLQDCDDFAENLAKELGWAKELRDLIITQREKFDTQLQQVELREVPISLSNESVDSFVTAEGDSGVESDESTDSKDSKDSKDSEKSKDSKDSKDSHDETIDDTINSELTKGLDSLEI